MRKSAGAEIGALRTGANIRTRFSCTTPILIIDCTEAYCGIWQLVFAMASVRFDTSTARSRHSASSAKFGHSRSAGECSDGSIMVIKRATPRDSKQQWVNLTERCRAIVENAVN